MRVTEFYKYKQGRPYSSPFANPEGGGGMPRHSVHGVHLAGEFSSRTEDSNYIAADEMVILADTSGSPITVTLPTAATNTSKVYWIKKIDSGGNSVTIVGDSTDETIDGETSVVLTLQYQYVMLVCDGTDWFILGGEYVKMEDILLRIAEAQEAAKVELKLIKLHLEQVTNNEFEPNDVREE